MELIWSGNQLAGPEGGVRALGAFPRRWTEKAKGNKSASGPVLRVNSS